MQGDWKAKGSKIYEKGRLRGESHSSIDIGNLWRKNQTSEQQSDSYRLHAIIEKNRPSSVWRNFLCFFFLWLRILFKMLIKIVSNFPNGNGWRLEFFGYSILNYIMVSYFQKQFFLASNIQKCKRNFFKDFCSSQL